MKYFTVDLEDWFHILNFKPTKDPADWEKFESRVDFGLDKILRVLRNSEIKATFFVLGWLAERRPELVRELKAQGHVIASHGFAHQLVYEQSREEFYSDILKSKAILEDIVGDKISAYRAPGFSITKQNLDYLELIQVAGFSIDCSMFPLSRFHGGVSKTPSSPYIIKFGDKRQLLELPISTNSFLGKKIIISGGGYFRITPTWFLKKYFEQEKYLMTYFHPRDFDENQPLLDGMGAFQKFRSYTGLKGAYKKLSKVVVNGDWSLILENLDLKNLPVISHSVLCET